MTINTRRIALSVLTFVLLTGGLPAAATPQDGEPAYSAEGAWFGSLTMANGVKWTYMDIYTSSATSQGREGTVLCTLPAAGMTNVGHGTWLRLEKNVFAFTAWRIRTAPDGTTAIGWAKFWGTIALDSADHFTGTMNFASYDLEMNLVSALPMTLTTEGKRMKVE